MTNAINKSKEIDKNAPIGNMTIEIGRIHNVEYGRINDSSYNDDKN